jgi:hypothetical protein
MSMPDAMRAGRAVAGPAAAVMACLAVAGCGDEPLATPEPRGVIRSPESKAPNNANGPVSAILMPEMLGARIPYLEYHYGPAMKIFTPEDAPPRLTSGLEERLYRIDGCDVVIGADGETIVSMTLTVGDGCTFNLGGFLQAAPLNANNITFGDLSRAYPGGRFMADCLADCGNAGDPSVYMTVTGPRADNEHVVRAETVLVGEAAVEAARAWRNAMSEAGGEDYVVFGQYNCGGRYDEIAADAFAEIEVQKVTVTTLEGRLRPRC